MNRIVLALTLATATPCLPRGGPVRTVPLDEVAGILDDAANVAAGFPVGESWEACVALEATVAGTRLAANIMRTHLHTEAGVPSIPGLEVDVGRCFALRPRETPGADVDDRVGPAIQSTASLVRLSLRGAVMDCDAAAWTDAALAYLNTNTPAVIAYVKDPTGPLALAAVPVDLTACATVRR